MAADVNWAMGMSQATNRAMNRGGKGRARGDPMWGRGVSMTEGRGLCQARVWGGSMIEAAAAAACAVMSLGEALVAGGGQGRGGGGVRGWMQRVSGQGHPLHPGRKRCPGKAGDGGGVRVRDRGGGRLTRGRTRRGTVAPRSTEKETAVAAAGTAAAAAAAAWAAVRMEPAGAGTGAEGQEGAVAGAGPAGQEGAAAAVAGAGAVEEQAAAEASANGRRPITGGRWRLPRQGPNRRWAGANQMRAKRAGAGQRLAKRAGEPIRAREWERGGGTAGQGAAVAWRRQRRRCRAGQSTAVTWRRRQRGGRVVEQVTAAAPTPVPTALTVSLNPPAALTATAPVPAAPTAPTSGSVLVGRRRVAGATAAAARRARAPHCLTVPSVCETGSQSKATQATYHRSEAA